MFVRRLIGFPRSWPQPQRAASPLLYQQFSPAFRQSRPLFVPFETSRSVSSENAAADTVSEPHGNEPIVDDVGQLPQNASQNGQTAVGNGASSDRARTHQFDTYRLVNALQSAGYSRPQAIALMKCLRTVLVNGTEFAKSHYLSRGDLENETYLFRAAMSELRSEVKTVRHNEVMAEKAEIILLQKELDALNQQTREDIEGLRNDVTIEMNNRKIATRAEQQTMVVKIQDLNYNFTKRLADMRTEIEAQKWQTTRALIVTILVLIVCGFGLVRYIRYQKKEVSSEGVQTDSTTSEPPFKRDPPSGSDIVTLG